MAELMKQYKHLVKNIDSFSNGQAALSDTQPDSDSMTTINIVIKPNDGLYKGGKFEFEIEMDDTNPFLDPPKIRCLTKIYHPNIDQIDEYSEGDICLNLLDELWTTDLTLEDYVQGLLFMFYNPNVEDPLNPAFDGSESEEKVKYNIRMSLRGKEVEGIEYDNVLEDGYESEDGETYDEDYDSKHNTTVRDDDDADNESTTSSTESISESTTTNDNTVPSNVPAKLEDMPGLSVIKEEEEIEEGEEEVDLTTGQHMATTSPDHKPNTIPSMISTFSWVLRYLRPPLTPPVRDDSILSRPSLNTVVMVSVAFIAVRFGLRFVPKLNIGVLR